MSKQVQYRMNWADLLRGDRLRPSQNHAVNDFRNAFEKDYHRIVTSASFRRLQDKTQVFPLDQSDFVRTRLTHSLEVSSLAKSLGQLVVQELYFRRIEAYSDQRIIYEIGDLLLCSGLIHDIGNPPFGHYGETTIRDWFIRHLPRLTYKDRPLNAWLTPQMQQDFIHFEGNAQGLRLLTRLHFVKDEFGMNLSKPLLNTMIKYPVSSLKVDPNHVDIKYHKMGYFYSEKDLYADIVKSTGAQDCRHPLTYLLEAADDIAYRTADIEDAYKKGRFSFNDLKEALRHNPYLEKLSEKARQIYLTYCDKLDEKHAEGKINQVNKPELYAIQNWVIFLQGALIQQTASSFCDHYGDIMNGTYPNDLFEGTEVATVLDVLGYIAVEFVFTSKSIISLEIAANKIIGGLLDLFIPACLDWQTDRPQLSLEPRLMAIISDNYRSHYLSHQDQMDDVERLYARIQMVTDFICGMTDSFAKSTYQKMNGL